ncbi:MAG: hypothetical protein ABSB86_11270 [Bryobacteraceae bacterium]
MYFGAQSLMESWRGLVPASFETLNERMAGHWLSSLSENYRQLATGWTTAAVTVARLLVLLGWRRSAADRLIRFAAFMLLVLAGTVLVHWVAFKTTHLLLPKNRTGLFLVVLFTVFLGAAVASALQTKGSRLMSAIGVAVLAINAIYFLGCLRLTYFKE